MLNLSKLKITNFAIIENIEVDFSRGFNVITGETGAGKSIVINALNLALGYKADISKIRAGAHDSEILSEFHIHTKISSKLSLVLHENDIPMDNARLTLRRKLYDTGRSSAWINNKPCSINLLRTVGNYIVDMHGQHAHQQLLNVDTHRFYLDNFGQYRDLLAKTRTLFDRVNNLKEKLKTLKDRQQLNREKQELWQFQFDEIDKINPKPGEMEKLEQEQKRLVNAERYNEIAGQLTELIYEGDQTLYNQVQSVLGQLRELNDISKDFDEYLESLEQAKYMFQELSGDITNSAADIEYNPARLKEINDRIADLDKLQKKYHPDIAEILKYKNELDEKLNQSGSLEFDIQSVRKQLDKALQTYHESTLDLSRARHKTARQFEKEIGKELTKLGFKNSRFEVKLSKLPSDKGLIKIDGQSYYSDQYGLDQVEFYIRTNPGEPMTPLVDTVSGGEVSRIMLAIKSILATGDKIPVLVFDEIDTGISGQVARIVGEEMLSLANNHQILCITHLPQIASLGDSHLSVRKKIVDNRSVTYIKTLDQQERITEIAQLIGGKNITENGLNQARELLEI
ncbi:MAG: DNA repair protein RecN [Fidelibacterota bacterium]